jgi:hypothetical protein
MSSFSGNPSGSQTKLRNAMQMCKCNPAFASKNKQRQMYNTKGIEANFEYVCRVEDADEDVVPIIAMRKGSPKSYQAIQKQVAKRA